jgi:hypothetical protein
MMNFLPSRSFPECGTAAAMEEQGYHRNPVRQGDFGGFGVSAGGGIMSALHARAGAANQQASRQPRLRVDHAAFGGEGGFVDAFVHRWVGVDGGD